MTSKGIFRLMRKLPTLSRVILFLMIACFSGCGEEQQNNVTIKLPEKADSLINDTVAVSYMVDSLKVVVRNAKDDTTLIKAIADLAAYWRKPESYLAETVLQLSIEKNYEDGIILGQIKVADADFRASDFERADSLLHVALNQATSTGNVRLQALALYCMGDNLRQQNINDSAIVVLTKANNLAIACGDRKKSAACLNAMGEAYRHSSQFDSAIAKYSAGLEIGTSMNDKDRMSRCLGGLGAVYRSQNDYPKALDCTQQSLAIARSLKDRKNEAYLLGTIGALYFQQDDFVTARQYFNEAMVIAREIKDNLRIVYCLLTIGAGYDQEKDYVNAGKYYGDAYKLADSIRNNDYAAFALNAMSTVQRELGQYDTALKTCERALVLAREIKRISYITTDLFNMAQIYLLMNDTTKALEKAEEAHHSAMGSEIPDDIKQTSELLSWLYDTLGDHHKAFHMHVLFMKTRDSLNSEEQIRKFAATEFQVKEEVYKADQIKADEELKRQKLVRNGFIVGSIIFALLAVLILYSLVQNRKAKRVIEQQKAEVETQKYIVEEKQKEIVDSINYAKRLQTAILPPVSQFEQNFPESFIFYRPKDIVAGDFYWMETIDDITFIAAADSTGHGVPGAMVSVVCSNALNRAVKEFNLKTTGEVLDKTTDIVLETFAKSMDDVADGMDVSLLAVDRKNNIVQWSGANNSLWYFKTGSESLLEIKADKQPVGKTDTRKPFTTHTIPLEEGLAFYLFTDGFADQFGGPKGKKFKYSQLQKLVHSSVEFPMKEQARILSAAFDEWKSWSVADGKTVNLEQVDDVTLLGIRL